MGLVYAEIELINYSDVAVAKRGYGTQEDIRRVTVNSLVDTGAYMLVISENIKTQLGLDITGREVATLADGTESTLDVAGPVEVRFKNRHTIVEALVVPGNALVLLGAIPMEGLDVIVDPNKGTLMLPPSRPYIAGTILM